MVGEGAFWTLAGGVERRGGKWGCPLEVLPGVLLDSHSPGPVWGLLRWRGLVPGDLPIPASTWAGLTGIVGLFHEHPVLLGHQCGLAALRLVQQDGVRVFLPVLVGKLLG